MAEVLTEHGEDLNWCYCDRFYELCLTCCCLKDDLLGLGIVSGRYCMALVAAFRCKSIHLLVIHFFIVRMRWDCASTYLSQFAFWSISWWTTRTFIRPFHSWSSQMYLHSDQAMVYLGIAATVLIAIGKSTVAVQSTLGSSDLNRDWRQEVQTFNQIALNCLENSIDCRC